MLKLLKGIVQKAFVAILAEIPAAYFDISHKNHVNYDLGQLNNDMPLFFLKQIFLGVTQLNP